MQRDRLGRTGVHANVAVDAGVFVELRHERLRADGKVVPIEVKASRNKLASLNVFMERDDVACGYKIADGNVGRAGKKVTLPHHLAMLI